MLNYLKVNNPEVKILAIGSILTGRNLADNVMSKYSDYISLLQLRFDPTHFSYGLFTNTGIASHPSDKGMRAISDKIWDAILKSKFL